MAKVRNRAEELLDSQQQTLQHYCAKNFWAFSAIAIGSLLIGPAFGKSWLFFLVVSFIATIDAVAAWLADRYIELYRNVAVERCEGKKPTKQGCKLMCYRTLGVNDWSGYAALCFFVGYLQRLWQVAGIVELLCFALLMLVIFAQHLNLRKADELL